MTMAPSLLDKWLFMGAVMADPHLSDLARRIAYLLTDLFDERRGGAWPSLDTIQTRTGASRQGCLNAIRQLEDGAWFMKRAGHGRVSSVYTPRWDRLKAALTDDGDNAVSVNLGGPKLAEDSVNPDGPKPAVSVNSGGPKEPSFGQVLHAVSVNPTRPDSLYGIRLEEKDLFGLEGAQPDRDAIQASAKTGGRKTRAEPEGFRDFWQVHPRPKDEEATRGAYREALRRGATPGMLLERAQLYADQERAKGTQKTYIKTSANWLRHGSWNNPPEPAPNAPSLKLQQRPTLQEAADRVFSDSPAAAMFREAFQ